MKTRNILAVSTIAAMLSACGGDSTSPYALSSETFGSTTTIADASSGAKAATAVTNRFVGQASSAEGLEANMISMISSSIGQYAAPGINMDMLNAAALNDEAVLRQMKSLNAPLAMAAPAIKARLASSLAPATTTVACDSGTMTVITEDTFSAWDGATYPVSMNIDITADNCVNAGGSGDTINGHQSMAFTFDSASSGSIVIETGDGDNTLDASKDYSTIGTYSSINSGRTNISLSGGETSGNMNATISSAWKEAGPTTINEGSTVDYRSDMAITYSETGATYDTTVNGEFIYTQTDVATDTVTYTSNSAYSNFKQKTDESYAAKTYTYTVSGTAARVRTPADCRDGVFNITTTTPIVYHYPTNSYTAGEMVINGNTTVTFDSNGMSTSVDGVVAAAGDYSCPVL